MDDRYMDLGVIQVRMDNSRAPTGMRIQKDRSSGTLSFEFGRLVAGRLEPVRYWKEDALIHLATLSKFGASLHVLPMFLGIEITSESLKALHKDRHLMLVEEALTSRQVRQAEKNKKFGASLGDRVKAKERGRGHK